MNRLVELREVLPKNFTTTALWLNCIQFCLSFVLWPATRPLVWLGAVPTYTGARGVIRWMTASPRDAWYDFWIRVTIQEMVSRSTRALLAHVTARLAGVQNSEDLRVELRNISEFMERDFSVLQGYLKKGLKLDLP